MGTSQCTRESIAVTPQTDWGRPYRRRLSSLCPVSNIHLWMCVCGVLCYSSFRVIQGQQPCVMTAPLYWELFIVLNVAESHWGSRVPHPSQHLIYSSVVEKTLKAIQALHHFLCYIFFILFPSTKRNIFKENSLQRATLTKFGRASSTQQSWQAAHNSSSDVCFVSAGQELKKKKPHRIQSSEWYRAQRSSASHYIQEWYYCHFVER